MSTIPPFTPQFLQVSDLQQFGLPTPVAQPNILNLVMYASSLIDLECNRQDVDGNGSLVWSTYEETLLLLSDSRNLVYLSKKPIVPVLSGTVNALIVQATAQATGMAPTGGFNTVYTGVLPSLDVDVEGNPSGLIAVSGRYGYTREDHTVGYPDLYAQINPLNLATTFGGPAPWVELAVSQTGYNNRSGEVWLQAGIMLQRYTEVIVQYTAGFDPNNMPQAIKMATAATTRNLLVSGGTTGAKSVTIGRGAGNIALADNVLDNAVCNLLTPYKSLTIR